MAKWYKTNGDVEDVKPENGKKFTVEEWHKYVGGYCAHTHLGSGNYALYDDEGHLKSLKYNEKGSARVGYDLVGPVLVIGKEDGGL
jgi:hypothetical protein